MPFINDPIYPPVLKLILRRNECGIPAFHRGT